MTVYQLSSANKDWLRRKEKEAAAAKPRGNKPGPSRIYVDPVKREQAEKLLDHAYQRLRSWDAVADFYGHSKPACFRILKDENYRPGEYVLDDIIRAGLPPIPKVDALPCPSCAAHGIFRTHAHDLDCHGDPDAVAVMVKPDAQQAIALIDQWLADDSGHDEAVWPVIEKALRKRSKPAEPSRKRKPMYRPVVDPEIGEVCKDMELSVNQILREYLAERDLL